MSAGKIQKRERGLTRNSFIPSSIKSMTERAHRENRAKGGEKLRLDAVKERKRKEKSVPPWVRE